MVAVGNHLRSIQSLWACYRAFQKQATFGQKLIASFGCNYRDKKDEGRESLDDLTK
jgi:hypothetical protein